jgi:hypothetical protein
LKAQVDAVKNLLKEYQDDTKLTLRRLEASLATISRSLGSISTSLTQIQAEVTRTGSSSVTVADSLQRFTNELKRLEGALKEHIGGHVGVLSESLVGRGGFWTGIWIVVGVQTAGWIIYELYRSKKDKAGKKFL